MKTRLRLQKDLAIAIGIFLILFATAAYYNIPKPEFLNMKFGWEYGNIAEALVNGKGFGNAFETDSGPTAWMPPLFVFILAGTFTLFGIKSIAAMWAVLFIKYTAMSACFYFLLTAASHTVYRKNKYLLVPLLLALIFINRDTYFRSIHDDWLNLFFSCFLVSACTTRVYKPSRSNTMSLYLLAFLLPLANPALAVSFAVVEAGSFLFYKPESTSPKFRWKQSLVVMGIFTASSLLWTYRNYQVFGIFIPIKSNFWFDFYQANSLDNDGLTTNSTFAKYHPINKNEIQENYLLEKESQFIQEYNKASLDWIGANPGRLLQNIGRRAVSSLIFMHHSEDTLIANRELFTPEDIEKLEHEKLISTQEDPIIYWISLTMPQDEFERQIHALRLTDETSILKDWSARKADLVKRMNDPRIILRSLLLSFVPFLCLICGLAVEKIRKNRVFLIAVTIYLTYLSPYILVSHYRRYQVPLIGIQSVFIFFITCFILERLLFRKKFS